MALDDLPVFTRDQQSEFSDGLQFPVAERAEVRLKGQNSYEVIYVVGKVKGEFDEEDTILFGKKALKTGSAYFVGGLASDGSDYPYEELDECSASDIEDYNPLA